jgi:hypothetical protein
MPAQKQTAQETRHTFTHAAPKIITKTKTKTQHTLKVLLQVYWKCPSFPALFFQANLCNKKKKRTKI